MTRYRDMLMAQCPSTAGSSRYPKRTRQVNLDTSSSDSTSDDTDYTSSDMSISCDEDIQNSESAVVLSDTDVLDCPICLDSLSPPVFQCASGHLVCRSCFNKINNKCPSCSGPIDLNRCNAIEKILESAKTSCQNREHGCRLRISYAEKIDHEKSCKYTLCLCPHEACNYVAVSNILYRHFSMEHSSSVNEFRINAPIVIHLLKDVNRVFLQERRRRTLFVLERTILPQGSLIHVVRVGPTTSSARNTYRLTVLEGRHELWMKSSVVVAPKCSDEPPMRNCLLVTSDFSNHLETIKLHLLIEKLE